LFDQLGGFGGVSRESNGTPCITAQQWPGSDEGKVCVAWHGEASKHDTYRLPEILVTFGEDA
jgi:hypothetical protein